MTSAVAGRTAKVGRYRLFVLLFIFILTTVNYADRATISIAGPDISRELGLNPIAMGYIFSAFGWSYVVCQLPGGWLLDRFGSKWVYAFSIALWSLFTLAQGAVGFFTGAAAVSMLFAMRFLVGAAEAPSFPANSRIVAAWFPTAERGGAAAVFNSAQYFATVLFAPLMGWIAHTFGWEHVFTVMGVLGLALAAIWAKVMHSPRSHPRVSASELAHMIEGGALVDMDDSPKAGGVRQGPNWANVRQLLTTRMLLGVYLAQYCITAITYFFLTWFPVYLVKERGLSILQAGFAAVLPALCGFAGGILGGIISDALLRRTGSLTLARKAPIVAGMLLSMVIIVCNYVETPAMVIGFMALSFFGKGIGSLGWAVVTDTSPKEIAGLSAGLFNTFGNVAAITTPIIIGYIVAATGSFNGALAFIALNAAVALTSYLFIVGEIRRVELRPTV